MGLVNENKARKWFADAIFVLSDCSCLFPWLCLHVTKKFSTYLKSYGKRAFISPFIFPSRVFDLLHFLYIQSNFTMKVTYLTLLTNYFTILQGRIPRRAKIYGNSAALT